MRKRMEEQMLRKVRKKSAGDGMKERKKMCRNRMDKTWRKSQRKIAK